MRHGIEKTFFLLLLVASPLEGKELPKVARQVATQYADIVVASYRDSLEGAKELRREVGDFVDEPGVKSLARAREAWIAGRIPYLQTEVYRFYGGPIDDGDGPEVFINSWPIDEAYIDYVDGVPQSGIINDPGAFPAIDTDLLIAANERGGETMISSGYHAIEFLLWGQDFYDDGPGRRPHTDYTTAVNAERRSRYLIACCDLLVIHLESLVEDWRDGVADNYRSEFLEDPLQAAWNIVAGAKHLAGTELAGERLLVAWDTQAQEDEHSCFSDTTHLDFIFDAQGLINVYNGTYETTAGLKLAGPGLRDLVSILDPEALPDFDRVVPAGRRLAEAIPVPFDQAILGDRDAPGRAAILRCVEILEDQAALWSGIEQKLIREIRD